MQYDSVEKPHLSFSFMYAHWITLHVLTYCTCHSECYDTHIVPNINRTTATAFFSAVMWQLPFEYDDLHAKPNKDLLLLFLVGTMRETRKKFVLTCYKMTDCPLQVRIPEQLIITHWKFIRKTPYTGLYRIGATLSGAFRIFVVPFWSSRAAGKWSTFISLQIQRFRLNSQTTKVHISLHLPL